jgi:hypothetical protein
MDFVRYSRADHLLDALLDPSSSLGPGFMAPGRGPSWEMAVAAGGLIKQEIFRDPDPLPYSCWDVVSKRMFNIQIVNSVAFEAITGLRTPSTPISAQTYEKEGVPFFQYYEENAMQEEATTIRDHVRSVGMIDEGRVARGIIGPAKYVNPATAAAGCTACLSLRKKPVSHLCERIVRPCNHAVCSSCFEAKNQLSAKYPSLYREECPVCSIKVTATLEYSSPMGMAGAEKHLGFALQDVQLVILTSDDDP